MSEIACPHCQTPNPAENSFCRSCGNALPRSNDGPRVIFGDALPQSAVGQALVVDDLSKQIKRVFYTLLAVGLIQLTCGAVMVSMLQNNQETANQLPLMLVVQFGVALIFIALSFWSRKNPLPAAIVGLVIFATIVVLNVVASVSRLSEGGPRGAGIGGLGIGWLDIVIMVLLVQGIQAALKYRNLRRDPAQGGHRHHG